MFLATWCVYNLLSEQHVAYVTQKQIAEGIGFSCVNSIPTVCRTIKRLADKGLVTKVERGVYLLHVYSVRSPKISDVWGLAQSDAATISYKRFVETVLCN
jgi:predicted transcriptional regulator of viral defense system